MSALLAAAVLLLASGGTDEEFLKSLSPAERKHLYEPIREDPAKVHKFVVSRRFVRALVSASDPEQAERMPTSEEGFDFALCCLTEDERAHVFEVMISQRGTLPTGIDEATARFLDAECGVKHGSLTVLGDLEKPVLETVAAAAAKKDCAPLARFKAMRAWRHANDLHPQKYTHVAELSPEFLRINEIHGLLVTLDAHVRQRLGKPAPAFDTGMLTKEDQAIHARLEGALARKKFVESRRFAASIPTGETARMPPPPTYFDVERVPEYDIAKMFSSFDPEAADLTPEEISWMSSECGVSETWLREWNARAVPVMALGRLRWGITSKTCDAGRAFSATRAHVKAVAAAGARDYVPLPPDFDGGYASREELQAILRAQHARLSKPQAPPKAATRPAPLK